MWLALVSLSAVAARSAAPTHPHARSHAIVCHVDVDVDATASGTPFPPYWKRSFGSGHAALTLRTDWQGHLKQAVSALGLQGVRYHGIFDDDMGPVVTSYRTYDFSKIGASWDYQLSLGLRPIVELSFMPAVLANCTTRTGFNPGHLPCSSTVMSYRGIAMPPTDFDDWHHLVRALALFATARYGSKEVGTWSFEVWNEFMGMPFPAEYMRLYNASVVAIKGVNQSYKIGGPASGQLNGPKAMGNIAAFMEEAHARDLPYDFLSTHFYPSSGNRTSFKPCAQGNGWDPACFANQMHKYRAEIPKAVPLYITEYNVGCCIPYYQHDTSGAAAFAFRSVGELAGVVDVLSWWTFTDIFEETGLPTTEFSNLYGAMSFHGVPKPVWRAFQLLNKFAGEHRVPAVVAPAHSRQSRQPQQSQQAQPSYASQAAATEDDGAQQQPQQFEAAKADGDAPSTPLLPSPSPAPVHTNSTTTSNSISSSDSTLVSAFATQNHSNTDLVSVFLSFWENGGPRSYQQPRTVTVHVKGANPGATAVQYRVDNDHANPRAAWKTMGSPAKPSASQIKDLIEASEAVGTATKVANGSCTVVLPPNSAVVLVFTNT